MAAVTAAAAQAPASPEDVEARLTPEDRALIERSNAVIASPESVLTEADKKWQERSERVTSDPASVVGDRIGNDLIAPLPTVDGQNQSPIGGGDFAGVQSGIAVNAGEPFAGYFLLISQSQGQTSLRDSLTFARAHPGLVLVLKGMLPNQSLLQLQRVLMERAGEISSERAFPSVQIDPTLFADFDVDVVPTLLKLDGERRLVASVAGVTSVDWLEQSIARGERGAQGRRGPVVEVGESDLMAQLRDAAAKKDFARSRAEAERRYIDALGFETLPVAKVRRARTMDPSFTVSETITDGAGRVIALQGQSINPLGLFPFTQTLVVIDAADAVQRAFAARLVAEAKGRRVTVLTSGLDTAKGLAGFMEAGEDIGAAVQMLTPELRERFRIERVPTVVRAEGLRFRIDEFPLDDQAGG